MLVEIYIEEVKPAVGWTQGNSTCAFDFMGEYVRLPAMPEIIDDCGNTKSFADLSDCGVPFNEVADLIDAQL